MTSKLMGSLGAVVIAVLLGSSSLFTIDAREVALVTSFGKPVRALLEPGLKVKFPWPVEEVIVFDSRSQLLIVEAAELLTKDKKNLVVEAFAVWRVSEPQRFHEAVGSIENADLRLSDMVVSQIAAALGKVEFTDLLNTNSDESELLPAEVLDGVAKSSLSLLGVEVTDVRIRHVGLPLQNEQSIYERMRAERSRTANQYRSEGEEKATAIRAKADREASEILAEAERKAAEIKAKADGQAARELADAFKTDPKFYEFLRSLDAYREILGEDAVLVVDSEGPAFKYLLEPSP